MKIICLCSYKPENECGVVKQLNRDGISFYKQVNAPSRTFVVDLENATDKNRKKLIESYANACKLCAQHINNQQSI